MLEPLLAVDLDSAENRAIPELATGMTPKTIVAGAMDSLEILLRLYYLRHGFDELDSFSVQFLAVLGFHCINELKAEDRVALDPSRRESVQATLVLSVKGFQGQGLSSWLARTTLRVLCKEMKAEDLALAQRFAGIELGDESQPLDSREIHSLWPLHITLDGDGDGGSGNSERKRLGNLIKQYADVLSDSANESTSEATPEPR
jgi:hypothetical protein